MVKISWGGTCPNDDTELRIRLEPRDSVVNGLMPEPDRIIEMFTVEAYCPECTQWVEPDDLRSHP